MAKIQQTRSPAGRLISRQEWMSWLASHCVKCGGLTIKDGLFLWDENGGCASCHTILETAKIDRLIEQAKKAGLGPE